MSAFIENHEKFRLMTDGDGSECSLLLNDSTSSGSNGLGTLLTVTGTGFGSENASIFVGPARCHVEQTTGTLKKFREVHLVVYRLAERV